MTMKTATILDGLFARSDKKWALFGSQTLLNFGIPFNSPHKFKFLDIKEGVTTLKLPYKRVNKNHLGGIHACAIATLGEFPAGIVLVKALGFAKYRLIMKKLDAEYFLQAKTAVIGTATVSKEELIRVQSELKISDSSEVKVTTEIYDLNENHIATVNTTWQLKNWTKVSFK